MKILVALMAIILSYGCSTDEQVRLADGSHTQLSHWDDRWLVINYWAEWCKPCIKEVPELNALDAKYPQVAVLGVNFDGVTGAELQGQVEKLGIAFPRSYDDASGEVKDFLDTLKQLVWRLLKIGIHIIG